MSDKMNMPGARGNAGFSMPFLIVLFCSWHLLFSSHIGENADEYGDKYKGIVSFFSSDYLCIRGANQKFYLGGFSDKELEMLKNKGIKGKEIVFWATTIHNNNCNVLCLNYKDELFLECSWWRINLYVLIIDGIAILLIPVVLKERKRVMREYGPSADPSFFYDLKEIFRRYQRPFIDDERTADKSVNEQKATKK